MCSYSNPLTNNRNHSLPSTRKDGRTWREIKSARQIILIRKQNRKLFCFVGLPLQNKTKWLNKRKIRCASQAKWGSKCKMNLMCILIMLVMLIPISNVCKKWQELLLVRRVADTEQHWHFINPLFATATNYNSHSFLFSLIQSNNDDNEQQWNGSKKQVVYSSFLLRSSSFFS